MLNHSCQTGSHALIDRGDDLYETPPCAVHALLQAETLPHAIWEPACGPGAIVDVLRESGHRVLASDLRHYDCGRGGRDFLRTRKLPAGVQAIVTNPPYRLAGEFVAHALELCPLVIMLLRLAAGWRGPKASSAVPFAWFIWDRNHSGPTMLHRLCGRMRGDHGNAVNSHICWSFCWSCYVSDVQS